MKNLATCPVGLLPKRKDPTESMNKTMQISPDEVMSKLQSGEWLIVSREKMAEFRAGLEIATPTTSVVDIVQRRMDAAFRGENIGPTSGLTYGQMMGTKKPGLKINLGSGQRAFKPPWINVDVQPKWCPDVIADGANLKGCFEDDSAEVIVLHHVLEHFGCGEADAMLKECYRILRPGGSLIVTVPDMAELSAAFTDRLHPKYKMDTQLFMTNVYGAYLGDDADRHAWGFDEESLHKTLQAAAPWKEVKAFDWREIQGASIAKDWWILGVEVVI